MANQKIGGVEFMVQVDADKALSELQGMKSAVYGLTEPLTGLDSKSSRAFGNMTKNSQMASGSLGRLSKNAGQAGIQIQQFVGQVQGGQSAMLALSQQAADLGIVLGAPLVGAIAGLSASFASILIPSLFESDDKFKDLIASTDSLIGKFEDLNEASRQFVIDKLSRDIKQTELSVKDLNAEMLLAKISLEGAIRAGKRYKDEQDDAKKEVQEFEDALQSQIIKLEEQKKALQELQHIQETGASMEEIAAEDRAEEDLERRREERDKRRIEREEETQRRLLQIRHEYESRRLGQFLSSLVSEEEAEAEALRRRLQLSQQYSDESLDTLFAGIDKAMEEDKKAADASAELEEKKKKQKIAAVSSTFSNLAQLMNTESRGLFEIGKTAAVAGAIVDGYAAVSKTMASVPYPLNIPLAAAQAAASAAQVSGILSTKFGDKSAGQAFTGGQVGNVSAQPVGPTSPDRIVSVQGIDPNQLFTGRQIVDLINEAQADGARIQLGG